MKTAISITIALALFLYVAGLNITLRPFKIKFETPLLAFGTLFLIVGIGFISAHYYSKGAHAAIEDTIKILDNELKNREVEK